MGPLCFVFLLCQASGLPYGSLNDLYDISYEYDEADNMIGGPGGGRSRTPQFVTSPLELVVNEGSTARLPCLVDRMEGFVLLWRRDSHIVSIGGQIVDLASPRLALEQEGEGIALVVSGVTQADQATYTCSVSAFKRTEIQHSLKVRVEPVLETVPANDLEVREGEGAVLACRVVSGSPAPAPVWRVPGGRAVSGAQLVLPVLTRTEAGRYTCEADNGFGPRPVVSTVALTVTYPPTVSVERTPESGEEMTLTCEVDAVPAAEVSWWRDGARVEPGPGVLHTGEGPRHSLRLAPVGRGLWGDYTCRASNPAGEGSAMTSIAGWAAPARVRLSARRGSSSTHQVDLSVASGAPVVRFRVQYGTGNSTREATADPEATPGGEWRGRLTLRGLLPATTYWLRVATENSYGENTLGPRHTFTTLSAARLHTLSAAPPALSAPLLLLLPLLGLLPL